MEDFETGVTNLIPCPIDRQCRAKVIKVGGYYYSRRSVPPNESSTGYIFVPHSCKVPPEAKPADILYYSAWENIVTGRKRYSLVANAIKNSILRAPDVSSTDYVSSGNEGSRFKLIGVFVCEPQWKEMTEDQIFKEMGE
jgi:hypothetical protein